MSHWKGLLFFKKNNFHATFPGFMEYCYKNITFFDMFDFQKESLVKIHVRTRERSVFQQDWLCISGSRLSSGLGESVAFSISGGATRRWDFFAGVFPFGDHFWVYPDDCGDCHWTKNSVECHWCISNPQP